MLAVRRGLLSITTRGRCCYYANSSIIIYRRGLAATATSTTSKDLLQKSSGDNNSSIKTIIPTATAATLLLIGTISIMSGNDGDYSSSVTTKQVEWKEGWDNFQQNALKMTDDDDEEDEEEEEEEGEEFEMDDDDEEEENFMGDALDKYGILSETNLDAEREVRRNIPMPP